MTGQASWISLIVLFVPALLAAFWWLRGRREARRYSCSTATVRCRQRGNQLVKVKAAYDAQTGEPVGILACPLEPGLVRCDRACLPLLGHHKAGAEKGIVGSR